MPKTKPREEEWVGKCKEVRFYDAKAVDNEMSILTDSRNAWKKQAIKFEELWKDLYEKTK